MNSRRMVFAAGAGLLAGAALGAWWWRKNPSACPYSQHFWLDIPRPFLTRDALFELLEPEPGNRILEIGPGSGHYSLHTAPRLEPGGTLDVLDIQQEMLDHTTRRANESSITNIAPTLGDAANLPYPDDAFDAAYLVATLGEIPNRRAALEELRRVIKPSGRLVVGEAFPDPHMVTLESLRVEASNAGLELEHRLGPRFAYFAAFRTT